MWVVARSRLVREQRDAIHAATVVGRYFVQRMQVVSPHPQLGDLSLVVAQIDAGVTCAFMMTSTTILPHIVAFLASVDDNSVKLRSEVRNSSG
jgi:hypothetical protein